MLEQVDAITDALAKQAVARRVGSHLELVRHLKSRITSWATRGTGPGPSLHLRRRPPVARPAESRLFTDAVLGDLKRGGYRPAAWLDLVVTSSRRSIEQLAERPLAAAQTLAVSVGVAWLGGARLRPAAACLLALTHLGLLGDRRSLGLANALTLVRAGLPARAWATPLALALDAADGLVARRWGPTAFGSFADPLADSAFWGAVALGPDSGNAARAVTALLWTVPTVGIAVAYFSKGRAIDYPRWLLLRRVSAATQVLLMVALLRRSASGRSGGRPAQGRRGDRRPQ